MVIILFGVTGAGKTEVGHRLADELGWKFYDADRFHPPTNIEKMRQGIPLSDADRGPWLEQLRRQIVESLQSGENAILACSALKAAYRDRLAVSDNVELVYLKGDYPLIAQRLAQRRDHFMNPQLLQSQFDTLEEPLGNEALAIEVDRSPGEIVREIRAALGI